MMKKKRGEGKEEGGDLKRDIFSFLKFGDFIQPQLLVLTKIEVHYAVKKQLIGGE